MGSNGSGKSTLSNVIAGHPSYEILQGNIVFKDQIINELDPHIRSLLGIFLCFQTPVEIQGVKNIDFLRKISNTRRKYLNKQTMDPLDFYFYINEKIQSVGLDASFLSRNINEGFSGGEKKRNELLQLIVTEPELCIFDEIDSGLDIDSIKNLSTLINQQIHNNTGVIIITHYKKLIDILHPNKIHVMKNGTILKTGDISLATMIENEGFSSI